MAQRIYDEPMVRRNMHLPDKQYEIMRKLSRKTGLSVADLYREGGDMVIRAYIERIKADAAKTAK